MRNKNTLKKIALTVGFLSYLGIAAAQENMMSKRGTPILPEANDWSIGFDASFLLNYAGNMFNNTANNAALARYQVNQTIVGKLMKDDHTAYVAAVRIGYVTNKTTSSVPDATVATNPPSPGASLVTVNDTKTNSRTNIYLGLGMQKYRGKGRLKGFYGGGVGLLFGNDNFAGTGGTDTYTYGNAITTAQNFPTSTNFGNGVDGNPNIVAATRATEVKSGSAFGFGVRGWLGAEYFFAPKLSLSAQYGWSIFFLSQGEGTRTVEQYNGTTGPVTGTSNGSKHSTFNVDVDNLAGQIILAAYF